MRNALACATIVLMASLLLAQDSASKDAVFEKAQEAYQKRLEIANEALERAKKKHTEEMDAAKKQLVLACDEAIKRLTKKGDLEGANALLAKKKQLEAGGKSAEATEAAARNEDGAKDNRFVIPRGVRWVALGAKGPEALYVFGPFAESTPVDKVLDNFRSGNVKDTILGVTASRSTVDDNGWVEAAERDNTDNYWFIYLKASGSATVDAVMRVNVASTNGVSPKDPVAYFDGQQVGGNSVLRITPAGHLLVVKHRVTHPVTKRFQLQINGDRVLYGM